jgi:hypothetical protein
MKIFYLFKYRGADKSLARPGMKQATETDDFDILYNFWVKHFSF